MGILVAILLLAAITLYLYLSRWNGMLGIQKWMLPVAFVLKCAVGSFFLYLFIYQNPTGEIDNDARTFLFEGEVLNTVFYESPVDYFRFLTGIGDTDALADHYMSEATHWTVGDQSIINDNKNVIRMHSLIYFFSFDSPFVHLILFSLVGLIGLTFIYLVLKKFSGMNRALLFWLIIFLPSALFWSSSVLKEPFSLLGIGLFLFVAFVKRKLTPFQRILGVLLSMIIMLAFKPYIFLFILPSVIFYWLYMKMPSRKLLYSTLTFLLILTLGALVFQQQIDKAVHHIARKQFDFSNLGRSGTFANNGKSFYFFKYEDYDVLKFEGDSVSVIKPCTAWIAKYGSLDEPTPIHLEPTGEKWIVHFKNEPATSFIEIPDVRTKTDLLYAAPQAIVNAVLRPFPTDPGSNFKYLTFLVSLTLFGTLILALFRRPQLSAKQKGLIYSIVLFSLLLSLAIGWVTPVLGAIVRYRMPIELGLVVVACILFIPKKESSHE